MATEMQKWQTSILKSILNDRDADGYHREYTMPRDSGVTTFLFKIVTEIQLYSNNKERIVVMVPNRYLKNEIEFSINSSQNSPLMLLTNSGNNGIPDNLKILIPGDKMPFSSYVDWLITDNANVVDLVNDNIGFQINNSIKFWTI